MFKRTPIAPKSAKQIAADQARGEAQMEAMMRNNAMWSNVARSPYSEAGEI